MLCVGDLFQILWLFGYLNFNVFLLLNKFKWSGLSFYNRLEDCEAWHMITLWWHFSIGRACCWTTCSSIFCFWHGWHSSFWSNGNDASVYHASTRNSTKYTTIWCPGSSTCFWTVLVHICYCSSTTTYDPSTTSTCICISSLWVL